MARFVSRFPMLIVLFITSTHAHVSMVYRADQPAAIRNANSATGNGRASVSSPCGGATTFGSNGIGTAQDGQSVTLDMRYAAGHNGYFRMAYACDTTGTGTLTGTELENDAAMLTAGTDECTVQGANGNYGDAQNGGATAIGQQSMQITCTLPLQNNQQPINCVMGILDQRDWGGCLDVSLVPAQAALPPSPPPAPFVTSAGAYYLQTIGRVDTAAGEVCVGGVMQGDPPVCVGGVQYTFTCCAISSGQLIVPEYAIADGGPVTATFSADAQAEGCPVTTPDKALPPPANTATYTLSGAVSLVQSEGGNKLTGTATMVGQDFEVVVSQGALSFTNVGDQQPILCDGAYNLDDVVLNQSGESQTGGLSGWGLAAIVLVVLFALVIAFLCYQRVSKGGGAGKPPPPPTGADGVTLQNSVPPPPPAPPPGSNALPPGWQAVKDPSSGQVYYYNQQTGATTWTNPSSAV